MIASKNKEKTIEDFIQHFFEEVIRNRPQIPEPSPDDFIDFINQFDNKDDDENAEKIIDI